MAMKTVAFATLGCKVNQYDSDAMALLFERAGYRVVDFRERADVYVVNTCTVTGTGDRKSRQMLGRAHRANPEAVLVVAGCYAQQDPEAVLALPGVKVALGTQRRGEVVSLCERAAATGQPINAVTSLAGARYEDLSAPRQSGHTRAHVKIQEGCRQFCTYCVIPYARGPLRSRPLARVLQEVEALCADGVREVVLTGIHLASYGRDIGQPGALLSVLEALEGVDGLERVRLGSLEPTLIDEAFIAGIAPLTKLCPHFHLSLQSGCARTLERMGRRYSPQQYARAAALLRQYDPLAALTTDVMVGFPGESEADHADSLAFVERMGFARIHVFAYSPRKGTPAAAYPDQVDPKIKEARAHEMGQLGDRLAVAYARGLVGRVEPVLLEQPHQGRMAGYTRYYVNTLTDAPAARAGELVPCALVDADDQGNLIGRTV